VYLSLKAARSALRVKSFPSLRAHTLLAANS
jgi:hypothetical protein